MPATLVLSRAVKPGRIDALRHRMDEMTAAAASAEGFAGSVRMAQTDALQHLLYRFHSRVLLDRFCESGAYAALIARGAALATGLDQVEEGRRVRIELPGDDGGAVEALSPDMAVGAPDPASRQYRGP